MPADPHGDCLAAPKGHCIKPKVVGPRGERSLVCGVRGCGEGIVGAYYSLSGAWRGGVHESDFEAGRYREQHYLDPAVAHFR